MQIERKFASVKLDALADTGTFEGYGAYFSNMDSYCDVILPGAFKEAIRAAKADDIWPAMLAQHGGWSAEDMSPIGIWTAMSEDAKGLRVSGQLCLDTRRGAEMYALMKMPRPAITGLSIGYVAKKFTVGTKPTEPRRTLEAIDLFEISLVTFPANDKSLVDGVKSVKRPQTIREFEAFLRDAGGFSRNAATAVAVGGFKAMPAPRDEGDDETVERIQRLARMLTQP
jgi:HK97 family phage prohead protease